MLSRDNNEMLTRVGPGTPMGDVMRQYWHPFLYPWELKPDGAPLRIRLLGENLVAFRTASGDLGLVADRKSTRLNSSHVALSRMPSSA